MNAGGETPRGAGAGGAGDTGDLERLANRIRFHSARMVARDQLGYLGQALSSAELIAGLFGRHLRPGRDHLVVSPGHYMVAIFAAGAETGRLEVAELESYGRNGSRLEAIGSERSPVADITCGSLGQGLSAGIGLALSDRLRRRDGTTFVLLSDGEMEEGQVWEAAMFAAHQRLERLVVLLDCNNSQVDGPVDSVTTLEPVAEKWTAFGWEAIEIDGHDVAAVQAALEASIRAIRPAVIVARTSVRQGLGCLPPDTDGHFVKLPPELAVRVLAELEGAR
ncbi:MAG: transketolase [Candidatus Dormibacteraceae bacterium]